MIEAMHVTYQGDSKAVEAQSDLFASMADSIDECAGIVKDARLQMDAIDREAHEAIQKIIDSEGGCVRPVGDAVDDLGDSRSGQNRGGGGVVGDRGQHWYAGHAHSNRRPCRSPGGKSGPPVQAAAVPSGRQGQFLHGRQRDDPADAPGRFRRRRYEWTDTSPARSQIRTETTTARSRPDRPSRRHQSLRDDVKKPRGHPPAGRRTANPRRLDTTFSLSPAAPTGSGRRLLASCHRSVRPPLCRAAG